MEDLKLIFFAVGLVAFAINAYLGIRNPDLVDGPMGEEQQEQQEHPLQKWDKLAYYIMWVSWGLTALIIFAEEMELI